MRADVRGLYTIQQREGDYIKLIERPAACADGKPFESPKGDCKDPTAKSGYFFKSLRFADEKILPKTSLSRFAVCAFPKVYDGEETPTFIINEGNTMFMKILGPDEAIDVWPDDPAAEGWSTLH